MESEGARGERLDAVIAALRRLPPRVFMAAVYLFACLLAVVFVVAQLTFGLLGVLTVSAVVILTMYLLGRRLESNVLRSTPPANVVTQASAGRGGIGGTVRRLRFLLLMGVIIIVAVGLFAIAYLLVLQNVGWLAAFVVSLLMAPILAWVVTKPIERRQKRTDPS